MELAHPYQWLCTNSRDSIYAAASRNTPRSLQWVLAAMLNNTDGYEPATVAERLGDRIPPACRVLAELLDYHSTGEAIWDATADEFLGIVLGRVTRPPGATIYSSSSGGLRRSGSSVDTAIIPLIPSWSRRWKNARYSFVNSSSRSAYFSRAAYSSWWRRSR